MSRSSAFARVLGITKSLSPLSFDRSRDAAGEADPRTEDVEAPGSAAADSMSETATIAISRETVVELDARDDPFKGVEMHIDETAGMLPEGSRAERPDPVSGVVMQFPGLAPTPTGSDLDATDGPHAELANDMIEAIETDIASLLASMEEISDLAPPEGDVDEEDDAAAADAADDREDATLALLSELNRLWLSDSGAGARP